MRKLIVLSSVLAILLISAVSAEIMLSPPKAVYSYLDNFEISATLRTSQETNSFFELDIICGNTRANFYRVPVNLKANEERTEKVSLFLTKSITSKGNCIVLGRFLNSTIESQQFRISDRINLNLEVSEIKTEPRKTVQVNGNAVKENSKQAEGIVELSVDNATQFNGNIRNGSFSVDLIVNENMKAGSYVLNVVAYEKYNNNIENEGKGSINLIISQVPRKLVIEAEKNITPGNNLVLNAKILDQTDDLFAGNLSLKILNPGNKTLFEKNVNSGDNESFFIESNYTPGYWKISVEAFNMKEEKLFFVEELQEASFKIEDKKLIITNTGNVIYRRSIEVNIGNYSETKNIELGVGESISLRLSAPDGSYDVSVSDGKSKLEEKNIALTGSIVGINKGGFGAGIFYKYPVVWLFLILVFGMFIFISAKNMMKKSSYSYPLTKEERKQERVVKIKQNIEDNLTDMTSGIKVAEHTLVLDGRKEACGIISVKIKNLDDIKSSCKETLDKIEKIIHESKGTIYKTGNFIIGIFSSATTKTFGNEKIVLKISSEIENLLKEHNRKFKDKIDFGISLNYGELVVKKDSGRLKFTAIGNAINLARKVSELSNGEVLLSEEFNRKVSSQVKAERQEKDNIAVYRVKSVSQREGYSDFIRGFLDRQKEK